MLLAFAHGHRSFYLHAGGGLLIHHEAASPMDAVMPVLLGAPRKVGFQFLFGGCNWKKRKQK